MKELKISKNRVFTQRKYTNQ